LGPEGGSVIWSKLVPWSFRDLAGFLPGGMRFVTIDEYARIHEFNTGNEQWQARCMTRRTDLSQISPDGRVLGAIAFSSMYFYDLTGGSTPRRIGSTQGAARFMSFAFHPDGKRVAVIHGGPTLVKVYDLATLKRVETWKWKLGPLRSLAFSPDGLLAAVGSEDGRVVVWEADE
jgi:WD40 repeat protein